MGLTEIFKDNNGAVEQARLRKHVAPRQAVELGTIEYKNLTEDGRHGDYAKALDAAKESGKPIFANFVEWSG